MSNAQENTYMSNHTYDLFKFIAQIALPASGTLYYALAIIWGLPSPDEVVGTVVAVDTFLGIVLGISNSAYKKSDAAFDGTLTANGRDENTGLPNLQMTITNHPDEILAGKEARLKVTPPTNV